MRFFGYDVRFALYTKLNSDFNTMIDTIRTERSDTTIPHVMNISIDNPKNQYPEIYIDITESEVLNDEELTTNINLIPEIYTVEINSIIKTQLGSIDNYADYYIEALQRILQGYHTSDITWGIITGTIRDDISDKQNQTYKICGVRLQIRIN
jgi:hypothetical protein